MTEQMAALVDRAWQRAHKAAVDAASAEVKAAFSGKADDLAHARNERAWAEASLQAAQAVSSLVALPRR